MGKLSSRTPIFATLLVVLTTCVSLKDQLAPRTIGQRRFDPPAYFEQYYHEVEACVGTQGDYSRLAFFFADDIQNEKSVPKGSVAIGYWHWHWIYYRYDYFRDLGGRVLERFVKHEMLHDILYYKNKILWHDPRYFDRCLETSSP